MLNLGKINLRILKKLYSMDAKNCIQHSEKYLFIMHIKKCLSFESYLVSFQILLISFVDNTFLSNFYYSRNSMYFINTNTIISYFITFMITIKIEPYSIA